MIPSFLVLNTFRWTSPKAGIVFAKGLHAPGSFISIAQKETLHHCRELAGIYAFHTVWERFLKTIYRGNNKIQITDVTRQWVAFFVLELSTQSCFHGYSHRQLRGFRREEHAAAHVLCLSEPVGWVAQNMSKKGVCDEQETQHVRGNSWEQRQYIVYIKKGIRRKNF